MHNENLISTSQLRSEKAAITQINEQTYAGFWRRFGAFWIDFLICLPLMALSLWLGEKSRLFNLYYFLPGVLFGLFFHVWLVKQYGGTPGKLALKIQITQLDGSAVGYREAFIRHSVVFILTTLLSVAMLITTIGMTDAEYFSFTYTSRAIKLVELAPAWYQPVNILLNVWIWSEFVVILTNKKRRALHDFMANTVVVRSI